MLGALGRDLACVERVCDSDVPEMVQRSDWQNARSRQGTLSAHADPALVFTTLCLEETEELKCRPGVSAALVGNLLGHGGLKVVKEHFGSGRGVCRDRCHFDSIYGCPHGCHYCTGGKVAVIFVNLEEFLEQQVIPTAEAYPWHKVFMFNSSLTDTLCFEPEYGLSKLLVEYYATTRDQHYLLHTKSANVEFLRPLDHRGHTIVLWSLTGETTSRMIEPGTASTEERILAAQKCQEAGYTIRFKFKPIVPVHNWREEFRRTIEMVFTHTRPDNLGLRVLAWMSATDLKACIDASILCPEYLRAMEECAETMKEDMTGPFPHWVRAEIYDFMLDEIRKHDPHVPVYLCTESPDMWQAFAPRLKVNPGDYACGCGPQSAPGLRRLERVRTPVEPVLL